jgi:hypothetical protein
MDKTQYMVIYILRGKVLRKLMRAYTAQQAKFLFKLYNDYDDIEEVVRA